MQLSKAQTDQFIANGYLIIKNFFNSSEVGAMVKETLRLIKDDLGRNLVTDGKNHNYQIQPLNIYSNLFRCLPYCVKVKNVVSALIGDPFVRQLDQLFFKLPKKGAGTKWHTDNSYFDIRDSTKGTGMWIALHDTSIENGTLHIIPGGHRHNYKDEHERDLDTDDLINFYPDDSAAIPAEVDAGGIVFFNYGIPHCTKKNTTDKPRTSCAFHFLRHDYIDQDSIHHNGFGSMDQLPIITGPEATGGLREYGQVIEGTWNDEVLKLLD